MFDIEKIKKLKRDRISNLQFFDGRMWLKSAR
jgi:hypothetical protein